jgi:predicted esterase
MADVNEMLLKPLVYTLPGMEQAQQKKDLVYHRNEKGEELKCDLYYPAGYDYNQPLPAVIFVHGDAEPELLEYMKDSGMYKGWGQLVAASKLIGITFNHRFSEGFTKTKQVVEDVSTLVETVRAKTDALKIDPNRLALVVFSAGTPYGLSYFLTNPQLFRCAVVYYGLLDLRPLHTFLGGATTEQELADCSPTYWLEQSTPTLPPMFVVKAALDRPDLNALLDQFVKVGQAQGNQVELVTHSQGHHAFDILDDNDESKQIIADTLKFIQSHI